MTYEGGKNGEGVYHKIISQIPPHRVYVELFLGSGAILRRKRPALVNIGVEIDPATVAAVKAELTTPAAEVVTGCALTWLRSQKQLLAIEDVFIYADPPYLMETRSTKRPIYRHEFYTEAAHRDLLNLLLTARARVAISGYSSNLYDTILAGWRCLKFQAMTRRGLREECLWMNYPDPVELHDYSFLGVNRTDRQRIKRKKERWQLRLTKMATLERAAVVATIAENDCWRRQMQTALATRSAQSAPAAEASAV